MRRSYVVRYRNITFALIVVSLLGVMLPTQIEAGPETARPVKVMTRNLYLGASLEPIGTASSLADLAVKAAQQFQKVQATDFPARATLLAREIKDADPMLVGMQEVSLWRKGATGVLDGPVTPATIVVYDFLHILLDALAAEGLQYQVSVSRASSDAEVPTALGFDVRLTQRDVILAKVGLPTSELSISNTGSGIFTANQATQLPIAGAPPIPGRRGWISADATVNGRALRFITTHLDSTTAAIRVAQATELLVGPANTTQAVILAGDLNSAPPPQEMAPSAYSTLTAPTAGFIDTWVQANPSAPGLTCCNPEDLLNPAPSFTTRLDHVLARPGMPVIRSKLVGVDRDSRTTSGLWPSDHAGIIATLAP